MNNENQHTENKETWRDEYIKTLAAFANTDGGSLCIGINDNGEAVGVKNSAYLLENLPNKIIQKLNIFPVINQIEKSNRNIIKIDVVKYDQPVSYNGKYYIRRGSTTQELADKELHRFLLQKSKTSWESVAEEQAGFDEIDEETVRKFKNLAKARVPGIENEDTQTILQKLRLIDGNGKLRRAAILLFGKDPQKYYYSAYFKIGRFASLTDIVTDDMIEGNLFVQLNRVLEVLRGKYLRNRITGYNKDWVREEDLEYPYEAIREAVINTLIHKDYSGPHVQMRIYNDEINLWNSGMLLEDLTVEKLSQQHKSVLRNELIANTFYKAGLIEVWGRGTIKIIDECKAKGLPAPVYRENTNGFEIVFLKNKYTKEELKGLDLNERQISIVQYLKTHNEVASNEYEQMYNISRRSTNRDLEELVKLNIIAKINKGKNTIYQLITNKRE